MSYGSKLIQLAGVFALLSIMAVGGGTAVLPEMKRMTVNTYHWVTPDQFRDIYSLGQVAPGPNMLMVMLIGRRVAGAAGAAVVALAFFLPDCILTLFANRVWLRYEDSPWRKAIQQGMAPVSIGLMLSGTYSIARLSLFNAAGAAIAAVTMTVLLWRHVNPVIMIGAGGLVYLLYSRLL
ncbi:MAG TPA: chromate transporter [Candidatus Binataceae bacterium]|jgi:chromate transporter|nr:chromate transporter [Candidatus Binataceae bacterium]